MLRKITTRMKNTYIIFKLEGEDLIDLIENRKREKKKRKLCERKVSGKYEIDQGKPGEW